MKKKVAFSWANALRSGLYDRTTHSVLKYGSGDTESYDALGVLCELAVKNGKAKWKLSSPAMPHVWWIDEESPISLSAGVKRWAGMNIDPDGQPDEFEDAIIEAFDSGKTFGQIADWIEGNFELL